jgi:hypothetical protein
VCHLDIDDIDVNPLSYLFLVDTTFWRTPSGRIDEDENDDEKMTDVVV